MNKMIIISFLTDECYVFDLYDSLNLCKNNDNVESGK